MSILDALYTVQAPFTLITLVPFIVSTAMLESGRGLAQRVLFGIFSGAVVLIQFAYAIYLIRRIWARNTHFWRERTTVLQYVDSFLGLNFAWGMASMAFWVIDTTTLREKYFLTHEARLADYSNWLVAIDFTSSAVSVVTTGPAFFEPVHVLSRLFYGFISAFHFFYLALLVTVGIVSLFENTTKSSRPEGSFEMDLDDAPSYLETAPTRSSSSGRRPAPYPGTDMVVQCDNVPLVARSQLKLPSG